MSLPSGERRGALPQSAFLAFIDARVGVPHLEPQRPSDAYFIVENAIASSVLDLGPSYSSLMQAAQSGRLSWENAGRAAAMEVNTLLHLDRRLASYTPAFAADRRLARTIQLAYELGQPQRVLLVGSGETLPEVFAHGIEISADEVDGHFADPLALMLNPDTFDAQQDSSSPQFRPVSFTAFDPVDAGTLVDEGSNVFGFPRDMVDFQPMTLGQAENRLQGTYDLITWYGALPDIIDGGASQSQRMGAGVTREALDTRRVLRTLFDHLALSGALLVTAGRSSDPAQEARSINFVSQIHTALDRIGYDVVSPPFPIFTHPMDTLRYKGQFYNTDSYLGNSAYVVALNRPRP